MRDVPMFSVPQPPPVKLSMAFVDLKQFKGSYAQYRPKVRVACDECIAVLHEAKGVGPVPLGARVTRRGGDRALRLCRPHAELWRAVDGK